MTGTQDRIGQSIGDYRLLRLLGKGTFGSVYLAEHLHDHASAAVKVLHLPLTGRKALHAFLNEARAVRLRHPHIVPILDFGVSGHDDLPYLVMSYADGGSLRDCYPSGSKLSDKIVDIYIQQLASALQYAHDHRVIHRDVKPENMLVSRDGAVQLSDFGIAKISELASLSSQHKSVGTPAYIAPEQNQGKPLPASDQYALAIVVYEWLAGRRPFQGEPLALMLQHHQDAPPSLCSLCPEVSPQVEQVIFKALAKAPEDRFPTITHFAEALHIAVQENTTQSLPHLDDPQDTPSPVAPPMPHMPTLSTVLSTETFVLAQTPPSPEPVPTSLPSVDTPALELVEIPPSSLPAHNVERRSSMDGLRRMLLVFLCLALVLGAGGATWFVVTQQQQAYATHSAAATAAALSHSSTAAATFLAKATEAANEYWAGVAQNGVQFGFNAAHTRSNSYERILTTANVAHLTHLWSFPTGAKIFSSPAVANGMVYVASNDEKLYVFDANCRSNCQPLWSFPTGKLINSSPLVVNGMVYIGSDDGNLYAFDETCRSNCQPLWSFTTGHPIASSPVVANGMLYVGSFDKKLYAFDADCRKSCQPLWSFQTGDSIYSSPAVANGIVYVGSFDKKLYAFDADCRKSCQPLWSFQTGDTIYSSPTVANGMVYIGSYDHRLYAFDATCRSSCEPLWSFLTGDYILSSPAVANGIVYIGSGDHKLYAFDANCRSNCQPLWFFPTGGYINSSPTVANGIVYVGSADQKLYAFDAACRKSCQPLWSFLTEGSVESSPAVVNGVIYIGSFDDKLYALGLPA